MYIHWLLESGFFYIKEKNNWGLGSLFEKRKEEDEDDDVDDDGINRF